MNQLRHTLFILFFSANVLVHGQADELLHIKVDSVVTNAIRNEAFPGCVIYAAKGDSIFFLKSYGYHTYDSLRRVAVNDIYDLASITKVAGATMALMKLYEDGYFNLDDPIGKYLKKVGRKVGEATFREVLSHQAGLYPWIPYYSKSKKKNESFRSKTISKTNEQGFNYAISDSLFLHQDFYEKIKKMIRKSDVSQDKSYRYSGLFFYLVPELVESMTDTTFEDYLDHHFYKPVGAESLTFNPLKEFSQDQIVPTEIDTFFRMTPIHGKVHDEGAIMMKGVSGNAGLFSNAVDLGKVFKLLINNGRCDSLKLLNPSTIQLFTTAQYPNHGNRRGLGFDKPLLKYDSVRSSVAESASFKSYGHTGYTGTIAWADPDSDLIFIFLTNRVYPNRTYRALYNLNVRPTIHQLIYDYLDGQYSQKTDPVELAK